MHPLALMTQIRDDRVELPHGGGLLVGYARVSTEDQKLDLQHDALARHGVAPERVYDEHISGARSDRPQLAACLKALRPGDTLVVWKLDRLGRNLAELVRLTTELERRGIGFRSLSEEINTTSAGGRFAFHVLAAVAQFERDLVSERTRAGLRAARLRGHKGGRPRKLTDAKWRVAARLMEDPTLAMGDIAQTVGISRSALYRERKRRHQEAHAAELARAMKK